MNATAAHIFKCVLIPFGHDLSVAVASGGGDDGSHSVTATERRDYSGGCPAMVLIEVVVYEVVVLMWLVVPPLTIVHLVS